MVSFDFAGEKIYSNLTRLVVVVWLFVVLILTSSYTANLSSMLTIQRLKPNVTDTEILKRTNSKIGCDGDSFVMDYLQTVLGFKIENIVKVSSEYNYTKEFKSKTISAAFLELPYAQVFMNEYCEGYTSTAPNYRFGGLSFVSSDQIFIVIEGTISESETNKIVFMSPCRYSKEALQ